MTVAGSQSWFSVYHRPASPPRPHNTLLGDVLQLRVTSSKERPLIRLTCFHFCQQTAEPVYLYQASWTRDRSLNA